jgi:hypothetical protein
VIRRITGAVMGAALIAGIAAPAVFAGEITGNGRTLRLDNPGTWGTFLHARSECAYSGQEDLQFEDEEGNPLPADEITKGAPARAQSWGQIPKVVRDEITAGQGSPGFSCNPTRGGGEPS